MSSELIKYDHRLAYEYSLYEPYKYDSRLLKKIHADLLKLALLKSEFNKISGQDQNSRVLLSEAYLITIFNSISAESLIIDAASNFIAEIIRDSTLNSFLSSLKLSAEIGITLNDYLYNNSKVLRLPDSLSACEAALAALEYQSGNITLVLNLNSDNLSAVLKVLRKAAAALAGCNLILLNASGIWNELTALKVLFEEASETVLRFHEIKSPNILEALEVVKKFSPAAVNILSIDLNSDSELESGNASFPWLDPYLVFEHSLITRGIVSALEKEQGVDRLRQELQSAKELTFETAPSEHPAIVPQIEGDYDCAQFLVALKKNLEISGTHLWINNQISGYQFLQAAALLSKKQIVLQLNAELALPVISYISNNNLLPDFRILLLIDASAGSLELEAGLKVIKSKKLGRFFVTAGSVDLAYYSGQALKSSGLNIIVYNNSRQVNLIDAAIYDNSSDELAYLTAGQSATVITWGDSAEKVLQLNKELELDLEVFNLSQFSGDNSDYILHSIQSTGRGIICPDSNFGALYASELQNRLSLECYQFSDAPIQVCEIAALESILKY